jgi:hypothetical protein
MSGPTPDPEIKAVEAALAGLTPVPGSINRDVLMFRAGQASRHGRAWLWPAVTTVLAATAAGLGAALVLRPEPAPHVQIVYVRIPGPAAPPAAVEKTHEPETENPPPASEEPLPPAPSTLQLQRHLLQWGLDGLPVSPADPEPAAPPIRNRWLDNSPNTARTSLWNRLLNFEQPGGPL